MIAMTQGISKPFHFIRITKGAKLDAIMWRGFLTEFNGTAAFLPTIWQDSTTLHFYSDASRTRGYGAHFAGRWFSGQWPAPLHSWSIAVCELFPITLGVITWAADMEGQKVLILCDNLAVTHAINKQSAHCPKLMVLIRALTLQCLKSNILIRSNHIARYVNKLADLLSKGRTVQFQEEAPEAERLPTPTPSAHALLCALKLLD